LVWENQFYTERLEIYCLVAQWGRGSTVPAKRVAVHARRVKIKGLG